YLVFQGLGIPQGFLLSIFIFSFSSVMGAVSFLPGGVGVAEGSMTGIMIALAGLQKHFAVTATVLIRLSTLWLGIFVGLLVLSINRDKFTIASFDEEISEKEG
ncbi:MAG: lysylphosphatidylglycerol synthase domain-containing protein, partial [Candidatus Bipolaricaulota bacterium]